ncbi:hypothetical protein DFJ74DRAFT_721998, partial [Hyaloraphidium curvatum]
MKRIVSATCDRTAQYHRVALRSASHSGKADTHFSPTLLPPANPCDAGRNVRRARRAPCSRPFGGRPRRVGRARAGARAADRPQPARAAPRLRGLLRRIVRRVCRRRILRVRPPRRARGLGRLRHARVGPGAVPAVRQRGLPRRRGLRPSRLQGLRGSGRRRQRLRLRHRPPSGAGQQLVRHLLGDGGKRPPVLRAGPPYAVVPVPRAHGRRELPALHPERRLRHRLDVHRCQRYVLRKQHRSSLGLGRLDLRASGSRRQPRRRRGLLRYV